MAVDLGPIANELGGSSFDNTYNWDDPIGQQPQLNPTQYINTEYLSQFIPDLQAGNYVDYDYLSQFLTDPSLLGNTDLSLPLTNAPPPLAPPPPSTVSQPGFDVTSNYEDILRSYGIDPNAVWGSVGHEPGPNTTINVASPQPPGGFGGGVNIYGAGGTFGYDPAAILAGQVFTLPGGFPENLPSYDPDRGVWVWPDVSTPGEAAGGVPPEDAFPTGQDPTYGSPSHEDGITTTPDGGTTAPPPPEPAGQWDTNQDGIVDAAEQAVWTSAVGDLIQSGDNNEPPPTTPGDVTLPADQVQWDTNRDGVVDADEQAVWTSAVYDHMQQGDSGGQLDVPTLPGGTGGGQFDAPTYPVDVGGQTYDIPMGTLAALGLTGAGISELLNYREDTDTVDYDPAFLNPQAPTTNRMPLNANTHFNKMAGLTATGQPFGYPMPPTGAVEGPFAQGPIPGSIHSQYMQPLPMLPMPEWQPFG
jgi:hypothetical protein